MNRIHPVLRRHIFTNHPRMFCCSNKVREADLHAGFKTQRGSRPKYIKVGVVCAVWLGKISWDSHWRKLRVPRTRKCRVGGKTLSCSVSSWSSSVSSSPSPSPLFSHRQLTMFTGCHHWTSTSWWSTSIWCTTTPSSSISHFNVTTTWRANPYYWHTRQ